MNRLLSLCAKSMGIALLAACGSGEVVVLAQLEPEPGAEADAQPRTLQDLEIWLLPYDRDVIFDSLEAAYPEREPPIPDSLLALQSAISQAQQEWQHYESAWIEARDSLQRLSEHLSGLSRTSAEYRLAFRDFQLLEGEVNQAEQQSKRAFDQFTALQSQFSAQSQEIGMIREAWANAAFADIDMVIAAKLKELKRNELADTTSADGVVRFSVKPGQWWVHARYPLLYEELYWNVPVDVQRGDPITVQLNRQNAEVRSRL